ncbi:hypothetical protein Pelo_13872 [Pelomyxa schiedti]|nr:hypothetical protein Pelo_13872 [Pelomyxa schiedti]
MHSALALEAGQLWVGPATTEATTTAPPIAASASSSSCSSSSSAASTGSGGADAGVPGRLRVVSFNIERGHRADAIGDWLASLRCDVALLQEVDVGCGRTGFRDVASAVARRLAWPTCAFCCEFRELHPTRGGGVHGNAVLSRLPLLRCGSFAFSSQPFDWTSRGAVLGQPRRGARSAVWADLRLPQRTNNGTDTGTGAETTLRVYSVHLENFTGIAGRLSQFSEVMLHAAKPEPTGCGNSPCVIGGDFNTLMHGVIRFLPIVYPSTDWMRFSTIGQSEAQWWQENIFGTPEGASRAVKSLGASCPALLRELASSGFASRFSDPFDKHSDCTFHGFCGLWRAKLDWLLSSGLDVTSWKVGGEGLSDHLAIYVDYAW